MMTSSECKYILLFGLTVFGLFQVIYSKPITETSCNSCEPGSFVKSSCTNETDTTCSPCPEGTFSSEANVQESCTPCSKCSDGKISEECTPTSDTVCLEDEGTTQESQTAKIAPTEPPTKLDILMTTFKPQKAVTTIAAEKSNENEQAEVAMVEITTETPKTELPEESTVAPHKVEETTTMNAVVEDVVPKSVTTQPTETELIQQNPVAKLENEKTTESPSGTTVQSVTTQTSVSEDQQTTGINKLPETDTQFLDQVKQEGNPVTNSSEQVQENTTQMPEETTKSEDTKSTVTGFIGFPVDMKLNETITTETPEEVSTQQAIKATTVDTLDKNITQSFTDEPMVAAIKQPELEGTTSENITSTETPDTTADKNTTGMYIDQQTHGATENISIKEETTTEPISENLPSTEIPNEAVNVTEYTDMLIQNVAIEQPSDGMNVTEEYTTEIPEEVTTAMDVLNETQYEQLNNETSTSNITEPLENVPTLVPEPITHFILGKQMENTTVEISPSDESKTNDTLEALILRMTESTDKLYPETTDIPENTTEELEEEMITLEKQDYAQNSTNPTVFVTEADNISNDTLVMEDDGAVMVQSRVVFTEKRGVDDDAKLMNATEMVIPKPAQIPTLKELEEIEEKDGGEGEEGERREYNEKHHDEVDEEDDGHIGAHHEDSHEDSENKKRTAIIVGVAIGGVALFALLFFTTRQCRKKRNLNIADKNSNNHESVEFVPLTNKPVYQPKDENPNGLYRHGPKIGPPSPRVHRKNEGKFEFPVASNEQKGPSLEVPGGSAPPSPISDVE